MHHRLTSVACTLLLAATAAGGAHAAGPANPFTGLGHEGSGLQTRYDATHLKATPPVNPFTGLGHEGSGLQTRYDATHPKATPPVNPFTGLGHEGSGLQTRYDATHRKAQPAASSGLQPTYDWATIHAWLG